MFDRSKCVCVCVCAHVRVCVCVCVCVRACVRVRVLHSSRPPVLSSGPGGGLDDLSTLRSVQEQTATWKLTYGSGRRERGGWSDDDRRWRQTAEGPSRPAPRKWTVVVGVRWQRKGLDEKRSRTGCQTTPDPTRSDDPEQTGRGWRKSDQTRQNDPHRTGPQEPNQAQSTRPDCGLDGTSKDKMEQTGGERVRTD